MSNKIVVTRKQELTSVLSNAEISQRMTDLFSNDEVKKNKFIATLKTIAMDRSLERCDITSIIKSAMSIAELDLSLNKEMGLAYIVAYKQQAQAVISYKGFSLLAKKAGYAIKVNEIYKCDEFAMQSDGFDDVVVFRPNFEERANNDNSKKWVDDNLKGVLVAVKDIETNIITTEFISISKIQQLARGAKTQNVYNSWAIEMYRAKAIKYVLSKMPIGDTLLSKSIALDNKLATLQYQESAEPTTNNALPPTSDDVQENKKEEVSIPQAEPTLNMDTCDDVQDVEVIDEDKQKIYEAQHEQKARELMALAKEKGYSAQDYLSKYQVERLREISVNDIIKEIGVLKNGN